MLVRKHWSNLWTPRWPWLRRLVDLQFASIHRALAAFPRTQRPVILDFGAGETRWHDVLPRHRKLITLDSYARAQYARLTELPETLRFDLILLIEVLEHVEKPVDLLRDLGGRLEKGGEIWITVPLMAREHPAPQDFRRWTNEGLEQLVREAGGRLVELRRRGNDLTTLSHLAIYLSFRLWLSPSSWGLALLALPFLPAWLLLGHAALRLPLGPQEGPLGYALRVNFEPLDE